MTDPQQQLNVAPAVGARWGLVLNDAYMTIGGLEAKVEQLTRHIDALTRSEAELLARLERQKEEIEILKGQVQAAAG